MKPFLSATRQFFVQLWSDAMLAALLFVPLVMGCVFRFGVPALEGFLCDRLNRAAILAPYYPVFDLLLCAMTTVLFSAAGALVLLDEADNGLSRAYVTSPVGRYGYLLSRVGVPTAIAVVYCAATTAAFKQSDIGFGRIALLALCGGGLSVNVSLLIPSLAKNRVEGMAVSKLSGLIMLGLPAALLLPAPVKYAAGFLPSFWMTELVMGGSPWNAVPALAASALLAGLLARRFRRRVL